MTRLFAPALRFLLRWKGLFQSGAIHWTVFAVSVNLLYWSVRLAICAHWVPIHQLPFEPSVLHEAANDISFGVDLFWGGIVPPGLGCVLLLAGGAAGVWGLDVGSTTAKIAGMVVGVGFFLYSGVMLCIHASDHITGFPLLLSGALASGCVVRLFALLPYDLLLVEKLVQEAPNLGVTAPPSLRARFALWTLHHLRAGRSLTRS